MKKHTRSVAQLATVLIVVLLVPIWAISRESSGSRQAASQMEHEAGHVKKGYLVIDHEANDPKDMTVMKKYIEVASPLLKKFGGHFLVLPGRRNRSEPLQGGWNPESFSIIEFPTYDQARSFYYSEAYQSVLPIRLSTYKRQSKELLVEGQ